eukprot:6213072-Pleurochrysis_carterae.AAC.2
MHDVVSFAKKIPFAHLPHDVPVPNCYCDLPIYAPTALPFDMPSPRATYLRTSRRTCSLAPFFPLCSNDPKRACPWPARVCACACTCVCLLSPCRSAYVHVEIWLKQ